jgi:uncharacterized protein DUF1569
MKTLSNLQDKQTIHSRIGQIRSDSRRAWGKMSAPQMICHLSDAFRVALGEKQVTPQDNLFTRTVLKWGGLWIPVPWPHGFQGPAEIDALVTGTPPGQWEADKLELCAYVERFAAQPASLATARSPVFGKMSFSDWMRWGYLHADHHLRQFYG